MDTNQFESAIFSTVSLSEFTEKSILFRLRKFDQYVDKKDVNPIVKKFARDSNVFGKIIQNIESIKKNSTDLDKFSRKMDDNQLRLSPVDFGPHNMIFKTDGTIIFIDFEYFGWDDPIKIVSNFVFHEGSIGLSRENKEYFLEQYKKKSSLSTNEIDRLDIALKLSEIDWISILLWSLTPEKILSRKFSSIGFDENKYLGTIAESINHRLRSME